MQGDEKDFQHFFEKLAVEKELPVTSQPLPQEFLSLYEETKEKEEEVLVITLSSKWIEWNSQCSKSC